MGIISTKIISKEYTDFDLQFEKVFKVKINTLRDIFQTNNNKEVEFHHKFVSLLGNRMYNLDKKQDCYDITKAIMGVTSLWPKDVKTKAFYETDGILGEEEVD